MKQNLIVIIVAVIVLFFVFKMNKLLRSQSALLQSQTDILMAVALKTGAVTPRVEENKSSSRKEKNLENETPAKLTVNKSVVLSAIQKRVVKLFDDETPKTAAQLRELYNKQNTPVKTKDFNNVLWSLKDNKGVVALEKLEGSDSVWGLSEWFEMDGEDTKLQDEFFNRIKPATKA